MWVWFSASSDNLFALPATISLFFPPCQTGTIDYFDSFHFSYDGFQLLTTQISFTWIHMDMHRAGDGWATPSDKCIMNMKWINRLFVPVNLVYIFFSRLSMRLTASHICFLFLAPTCAEWFEFQFRICVRLMLSFWLNWYFAGMWEGWYEWSPMVGLRLVIHEWAYVLIPIYVSAAPYRTLSGAKTRRRSTEWKTNYKSLCRTHLQKSMDSFFLESNIHEIECRLTDA